MLSNRRKCPIHSNSSSSSTRSYTDEDDHVPDILGHHYGPNSRHTPGNQQIIEEKIYLTLKSNENLGCSVVRGPPNYPGIFVQEVKAGGVAEASGLQVGDQIVGLNGFSFYPGHYNFDEAISKIKASRQMSLTIRKRVGITFFPHFDDITRPKVMSSKSHNHHKVRAVVHHSATTLRHRPTCHQSSSSDLDSDNEPYDPEKDFDLKRLTVDKRPCKVHGNRRSRGQHKSATLTPDELLRMQERLDEERRILQSDQLKLQQEMHRLTLERQELESLRNGMKESSSSSSSSSDGISSCSSSFDTSSIKSNATTTPTSIMSPSLNTGQTMADTNNSMNRPTSDNVTSSSSQHHLPSSSSSSSQCNASGSIDSAISSSSSSPRPTSRNGPSTPMGFLDELKKLAENRPTGSEDGLLMDTLKKTAASCATGESNTGSSGVQSSKKNNFKHPDDEKRKQHEMLMEEFKSAHLRMFGSKSAIQVVDGPPTTRSPLVRPIINLQSQVKMLRTSKKATSAPAPPPPPPPPPPPREDSMSGRSQVTGEQQTMAPSSVLKSGPSSVTSMTGQQPLVTISSYKSNQKGPSGQGTRRVLPVKINLIKSLEPTK